jgi:glycosyltransferase involved in cell wall biosynthesis
LTKDKQTLIILSPGFPASEEDTTCLPAQQLFVQTLKKKFPSLNIIVIAFEYPFSRSEYMWNKIKVISFNGWKKSRIVKLFLWRDINKTLKKIKDENNIIGLLSFWYGQCAFIGKKFGKKYSIKHYCWIFGQDAKKNNRYVTYIKPQADELIALSDFIQSEFKKNHSVTPPHIIPLGIGQNKFSTGSIKRDIDLLGAGSLIPLKQYEISIEVAAELKKSKPDIHALVCGRGPEKNKLQLLINKLGVNENVTLTGELPHEEVLQLMKRTKIFLHPSSYEGFGVVCLEALSAGAHVISFIQPMKQKIDHWHIIKTKKEMVDKANEILKNEKTDHQPVIPYSMNDTVRSIMKLFNYKEAATS